MDFKHAYIELPGEANPLNRDSLIRNLALGAGRNAATSELQTAAKQLQVWENQSPYYPALQSVFVETELPFEVRYLAILQLLNAVTNKHAWGRATTQGVTAQDRQKIRSQLLVSSYREPDDRLARQNAILCSKIARTDFPREWPGLFDDLNATIGAEFDHQNPVHLLQMRRALELLQCIVKEMSKASLKISVLRSKAPEMLGSVCRIFQSCCERFVNLSDAGFSIDDANALGLLVPTASIIRRLISKGYQSPHNDERAKEAFKNISLFWHTRAQQQHPAGNAETSSSKDMLEKVILQISKLHLELAENDPVAFVLLPGSAQIQSVYLELIQRLAQVYGSSFTETSQIQNDGDIFDEQTSLMEKLVLKGILLTRGTLRAMSDPNAIKARTDQEKEQKEHVVQILQAEFFQQAMVQSLLETIVSKYFVFKASDLQRWEEEPDEWEAAEGGDTEGYRYSVRLSAEKLFLDLVQRFTDVIVPSIVNLVQATTSGHAVDAVQKESIYTALGLGVGKIFVYSDKHQPSYNFNQTLPTLIADLQNRDPSYRLIRRRIAILLGQWIHVQVSKENRPLIYQIFLHLLDKSDEMNDLVVRVTAGRQLKEVISDWEFESEPFLPYAPDVILRVMNLIAEVELPETKMALLETISLIVEQMGKHIAPFADHIVSILPSLWDETGEETLRKQVIVTLLVNMLSSMGNESKQYQDFALFIIKAVLDPDSSLPQLERMALLADALDLWRAVLDNTPNTSAAELHPDLLALLKTSLIPALGMDSEARRAALEIASSYFLLIPAEFLGEQAFVVELLRSQAPDLRGLKPEASAQVFEVVEQLLRAAEDLASTQGIQTVTNAMLESGFLHELFAGLREAYVAHQTTGPKAIVSEVQGQVETDFFAIVARILYASPELFISVLQNPASGLDNDVDSTLNWLLEEFFSHAQELATDPPRQKLLTMALTHLFTTGEPFILSRLQQLMDLWISVINELTEGNEDKSVDSLVYLAQPGAFTATDGQSAGEARRAGLQSTDPVHKVNLKDAVKYAVGVVVEKCGGAERFQEMWLVNVDATIVKQFGELGVV